MWRRTEVAIVLRLFGREFFAFQVSLDALVVLTDALLEDTIVSWGEEE